MYMEIDGEITEAFRRQDFIHRPAWEVSSCMLRGYHCFRGLETRCEATTACK